MGAFFIRCNLICGRYPGQIFPVVYNLSFSNLMIAQFVSLPRKPSRLHLATSIGRSQLLRGGEAASAYLGDNSLRPMASRASSTLSHTTVREGGYMLQRMASRGLLDSGFSTYTQYKVKLHLTSSEISLLRYTWTRMLVEDTEHEQDLALPIPGSLRPAGQERNVSAPPRNSLGALSTFCTQLYGNLLSMDPELEKAFPSLRHQAVSMAGVMSLAINLLDNLPSLDDYLIELGNRHSRVLGIEPAQFEMMGEALIQTFVQRFGTRFNHELEILWIKFYMYLANSLIQFGLDPVLRMGDEDAVGRLDGVQSRNGAYPESVFSAETDAMSLMMASRRTSVSTALTSIAPSVKPNADAAKAGVPQAKPKKSRTRFGRKKGGDCVIV